MLAFYADAVEPTLDDAINSIKAFLQAELMITAVEKSNGKNEAFSRQKLAKSVRAACLGAEQSDLAPARAIVARAIQLLLVCADEPFKLTTEAIKEAVWQALAELASEPAIVTDYDAIRNAWEAYSDERRKRSAEERNQMLAQVVLQDKPLNVPARKAGTHSLIWGTDVGRDAALIFDEIRRVPGITEIRFGPFTDTGSPPAKPHVRLQASKTPHIIDGKCYDKGNKGTLQTFQIRVASADQRDAILLRLRSHLEECGYVRSAKENNAG